MKNTAGYAHRHAEHTGFGDKKWHQPGFAWASDVTWKADWPDFCCTSELLPGHTPGVVCVFIPWHWKTGFPSVCEIQCIIWQRSPGFFHFSDKDRSPDTDLPTSCFLSNFLSFTLNPGSTSEPPAKLLKDDTSLGCHFMSGYGTDMLMEVRRGMEGRVLKHHPLSWSWRERPYQLTLLGVKEGGVNVT